MNLPRLCASSLLFIHCCTNKFCAISLPTIIGVDNSNSIWLFPSLSAVGKSTFATHLALALKTTGCKVGLVDADIYGPSGPKMVARDEALWLTLPVEGMTCQGCVGRLEKVLRREEQVEDVLVQLDPGQAKVKGAISKDRLQDLIQGAGFEVPVP